jgi:hypothetical protein
LSLLYLLNVKDNKKYTHPSWSSHYKRIKTMATWPLQWTHSEKAETVSRIFTEGEPLPPSKRLVVILPDSGIDIFTLPRKIWNLAAPDHRQVLLLTRPAEEGNELHSQRNLTTLAALIRDPLVEVQTKVVLGISLEQAIRRYSQPGDVLVCFEEQRISRFLTTKRLADLLAQKNNLPIYTLKGGISEETVTVSARLVDFALLALCIVSLVTFFIFGVWIDRNSVGTSHAILQILAICIEAWVIAACANRSFKI